MAKRPVVYVVDDDPQIRESLTLALADAGWHARVFASAEEFLDSQAELATGPACLIVDVRLPGLSGIGLQARLRQEHVTVPVIVLTGHGKIPMAVEAIKQGAFDFLQKPIHQHQLLECVQKALDAHAEQLLTEATYRRQAERMSSLSDREREVMALLVNGKTTKEMAAALKIGPQTVAKHRSSLFEKLEIESVAELVRLQLHLEQNGSPPGTS
jgi:two-component system, LuxR family, response regulator FixJ